MTNEQRKAFRLGVLDYFFVYIEGVGLDQSDPEFVAYIDQLSSERKELQQFFSPEESDWRRRLEEADDEMDLLAGGSEEDAS